MTSIKRRIYIRIICIFFAFISVFILNSGLLSACTETSGNFPNNFSDNIDLFRFKYYKDVPGITQEEINVIEHFIKNKTVFTYGMPVSNEAFYDKNGEIKGYTTLLCNWLSELFGLQFEPAIYEWNDLINGLETGEVDFTGELTSTEERRKIYFMTESIAERTLKYFYIADSMPPSEIAAHRPVCYAFLSGTNTHNTVIPKLEPGTFETVFVDSLDQVYNMLKSGEIDVFLYSDAIEAGFDDYGDVVFEDFFPVVYRSVSITTQNPELQAFISVIDKVLQNGGMQYLTTLYNLGYKDYTKHKLFTNLTEEELQYIQNNPVIRLAVEQYNYPSSFYNNHEKQWNGIIFDVLNEVRQLTGLSFEAANAQSVEWPVLLKMLEDGKVPMISNLVRSKDREGRFLWADTPIMTDYYVLLSKADLRNISINEIVYEKVGVAKDSVYAELFRNWFPDHTNIIEYETSDAALKALDRGEVNLVMSGCSRLLSLTNYYELTDYKLNVLFDDLAEFTFGFNKNESVLCSIINKTLALINVKEIEEHWKHRIYDYQAELARTQIFWLVCAVILILCVLLLLFILFQRKHNEGRRLECMVTQRTNELNEKHTLLEAVIKNYKDIIWCVDTSGIITIFKGKYLNKLGIEPSFMEGKSIETLRMKKQYSNIIAQMEKTFREGPQDYICDIESVIFHSRTTPIFGADGNITGVVGSTDDVSDMIGLQRDLETALKAANVASDAKNTFLTTMSHEMRTPLNAVIGLSELLLSGRKLDNTVKDKLEKIYMSGITLLNIVNDILDLSKIESGKFEISPVKYDTPSLINDTVTLNIVRIGEKPVTFNLIVDENLPGLLYGDDLRIKQIFNNLLSNAFKYTNSGIVEWNVSFENDGDTGIWLISSIKDSGIGIKPEDIQKLFSDYNQADIKINRKVEGTGLGLAITKRLVEMMDGNITVESEYGVGTTFHVRLHQKLAAGAQIVPIGKNISEDLMNFKYTVSKRAKNAKLFRVDLSYANVLIVDDVPVNLDVLKGMMNPYGMHIECALSGQQAIDMIKSGKTHYSAVFMDHMMPDIDGIETTRIIREEIGTDYARNIPIIAVTANAIVGNEELFLSKGFQAFITKPIDIMKLDAVLRQYVRDKNLEKEAGSVNKADSGKPLPDVELAELVIDGLDIDKGVERFSGDKTAYIQVLRSYAANTRPLIHKMAEYLLAENLRDYAIAAHGIKGSSYGICANEIGKAAEELEIAAKSGNIEAVENLHSPFGRIAETLLDNISSLIASIDAAEKKPSAISPDPALLEELHEACREYDIGRIKNVMAQLESFKYKVGGKIVVWLRSQIDTMNIEEIYDGDWPEDF
jgi:signal transduction histidine kinase/DNA-binding response OmpR family regulator/ABC-type amino acid transport substrate-binding protein